MDTTEKLEPVDQDRRLVAATASDAVHPFRVKFSDAELAELGNGRAIESSREGTLPYPDGTIIARLA